MTIFDEDRIEIRLIASMEWRGVLWFGRYPDTIRVGTWRWRAWRLLHR